MTGLLGQIRQADLQKEDTIKSQFTLSVLRAVDPLVQSIVVQATFISMYTLDETGRKWHRADIEGFLYVVELERSGPSPRFRLLVLNQRLAHHLIEDITHLWDLNSEPHYVFYRVPKYPDSIPRPKNFSDRRVHALWFHSDAERLRVASALNAILLHFAKLNNRMGSLKPGIPLGPIPVRARSEESTSALVGTNNENSCSQYEDSSRGEVSRARLPINTINAPLLPQFTGAETMTNWTVGMQQEKEGCYRVEQLASSCGISTNAKCQRGIDLASSAESDPSTDLKLPPTGLYDESCETQIQWILANMKAKSLQKERSGPDSFQAVGNCGNKKVDSPRDPLSSTAASSSTKELIAGLLPQQCRGDGFGHSSPDTDSCTFMPLGVRGCNYRRCEGPNERNVFQDSDGCSVACRGVANGYSPPAAEGNTEGVPCSEEEEKEGTAHSWTLPNLAAHKRLSMTRRPKSSTDPMSEQGLGRETASLCGMRDWSRRGRLRLKRDDDLHNTNSDPSPDSSDQENRPASSPHNFVTVGEDESEAKNRQHAATGVRDLLDQFNRNLRRPTIDSATAGLAVHTNPKEIGPCSSMLDPGLRDSGPLPWNLETDTGKCSPESQSLKDSCGVAISRNDAKVTLSYSALMKAALSFFCSTELSNLLWCHVVRVALEESSQVQNADATSSGSPLVPSEDLVSFRDAAKCFRPRTSPLGRRCGKRFEDFRLLDLTLNAERQWFRDSLGCGLTSSLPAPAAPSLRSNSSSTAKPTKSNDGCKRCNKSHSCPFNP